MVTVRLYVDGKLLDSDYRVGGWCCTGDPESGGSGLTIVFGQ